MTIQINDLGDGRFELVELRPVCLGVMNSRSLADMVATFLNSKRDHRGIGAAVIKITDEPADHDVEVAAQQLPEIIPVSAPVQVDPVPDQKPATASVLREPVTTPESPLDEAFERIGAGEPLGVVADELGISMPILRSRWARHCRTMKDTAAPEELAPVACKTCGKEFRPSSDGADTCARCSRDLGVA